MKLYPFELEANLIQLAALIIFATWHILRKRDEMTVSHKLFLWGIFSLILLNFYWIAMLIVDGSGTYTTFTATDTAFLAAFLCFVSVFKVETGSQYKQEIKSPLVKLAIIIGIWNCVWWYLWNSSLIVDILWCICITLFLIEVFYSIDQSSSFKKGYRRCFFALLAILFIFEIPQYFNGTDSMIYIISDWTCFAAWILIVLLFFLLSIREKEKRSVYLFVSLVFALLGEYLTDGYKYTVILMMVTVCLSSLLINYRSEDLREVGK